MINRFLLLLSSVTLFLFCSCSAGREIANLPVVRVLTFNIHHGEGMEGTIDVRRAAKVIMDSRADIVALQEVDRGAERSHRIDFMTTLSDLTGMTYAFGKNIDFQGGDYGNGILTRFPILAEKNIHYQMIGSAEQRGLLELVLDVRGVEVVFMNTHLDDRGDDTERLMNIKEIHAAVKEYPAKPALVCGDFNDEPSSRTIALMRNELNDAWSEIGAGPGFTYPATEPVKRIDYIFVSKPAQVDSSARGTPRLKAAYARVLQTDVSDHLPVLVEFELN